MVKMMDKKAMEPTSTITAIVVFIVILVVILLIAFYFSSSTKESGIFKYATDWVGGFKW
jgi:flagellar basal body-associated protein FliL